MIAKVFPFVEWFQEYGADSLKADLISGLTVALVLIPQSMAYAQLAGLPPYYGLYASFLPPMVAALWGSSRQLATGPVAVVSLMTSASLEPLAAAGSEGYIAYAVMLALMVGVFQLALGVFRLGLVVNFLSHPVVNGFTNAAALIIASSQLSKMFGVYVDKAEHHYETIFRVCEAAFHYTHLPTLGMGCLAVGVMYGLKRWNPRIPNVLAAVGLTTVLSWAVGFHHDAHIPLEQIVHPAAHEQLAEFNAAMNAIPALAAERTAVNRQLEAAKKAGDAIARLDAEHDAAVLTININRKKHAAHLARTALREMLFTGVAGPDGKLTLHLRGQAPAGLQTDGRTWRIKAGNKPVDPADILVTGGGAVVGKIPEGLPTLSLPGLDVGVMGHLFSYAVIISLLGFMEAISIAKAIAAKTGQRLDPNQELIGQGLANICGAAGQSYPTSGSFSRSAVNLQAGARTGLSSVFTSAAVVIALLFLTPLLYHLPQAVLAAVIMMAVVGLINVSSFVHAWRAQWYDGAISVSSFFCTLAFAPHLDKGIMIGVVLSLGVFLYKSMRPSAPSLSRVEGNAMRDAVRHGLAQCEYMDFVRFDGPLFFANASYLENKISDRLRANGKLRHIVLVCNGMNDMDASGEEVISLLVDNARAAGVDISLSGVNEAVMDVLERTRLAEKIGPDHIFPTMEHAICEIHEAAHPGADKRKSCPLTNVCRLAA